MTYTASVTANVTQSTSSAGVSNLNNSIFISEHAFFAERVRGFSSLTEVTSDGSIPTDSNLYKAMQQAFSQSTTAVPVYAGRRQIDSVTLTPTVTDNNTYKVTFQTLNETDGTYSDEYSVEFTSGTATTAALIAEGLDAAITTAGVPETEILVSDTVGALLITGAANRQIIVTGVTDLVQTFVSTETGTDCIAETLDENKEDYYFVTTESRDETFVQEVAAAIEGTTGSNPKMYAVCSASVASLVTKPDSYADTDILQMLQQLEYDRSFGFWHEQADSIFPELAACVLAGSYTAGKVNWKFLQGTAPTARHPVKDRVLNTAEQGYISDRNASWVGSELGLSFLHGGQVASGGWIDLQQIVDYTKVTMEANVLTVLVNYNTSGSPLNMTSGKLAIIKDAIESVLSDGVNDRFILRVRGIGYANFYLIL